MPLLCIAVLCAMFRCLLPTQISSKIMGDILDHYFLNVKPTELRAKTTLLRFVPPDRPQRGKSLEAKSTAHTIFQWFPSIVWQRFNQSFKYCSTIAQRPCHSRRLPIVCQLFTEFMFIAENKPIVGGFAFKVFH